MTLLVYSRTQKNILLDKRKPISIPNVDTGVVGLECNYTLRITTFTLEINNYLKTGPKVSGTNNL